MKTYKLNKLLILSFLSFSFLTSCLDEKLDDINTKIGFDFKTVKNIELTISTFDNSNQPLSGVGISIYSTNPLSENGSLIQNADSFLMYKGSTTSNGKMISVIATPTYLDSLTILVNYIGLPTLHQVKIDSDKIAVNIGGAVNQAATSAQKAPGVLTFPTPKLISGFYVLGSWNSSGFPNYLTSAKDIISNDFLNDVNATLPENSKLQNTHPEYFNSEDDGSIILTKDAEVWVTFVHEGAGYKNTLGYYTHPTNTPPASKQAIRDATIIFPNVSYSGSGGMLASGNKVQLLYLDPQTNTYTNIFPAGTTVAWWFRSNGFGAGTLTSLSAGYNTFYSDVRFNPESNPALRKHNVLLRDDKRQLLLIGFEDIHREQKPDDDFNDAVFYATASPYTAIKTDIYKKIDSPNDTDNDGVSDTMDDYPNDPNKVYNNYYPGVNQVGTLAFEDLWPIKGDYDFNDLVLDYTFNQITNAQNNIVELSAELTVRAIGASLRNAFAIELNTTVANIKSVNGQKFSKSIFALNTNGTEQNQSKAVIPVFDDSFNVLKFNGSIVNTINGGNSTPTQKITIKVEFNNPIPLTQFGTAPYNPFIVIGGDRGREVHLPGGAPTQLANASLFGTGDDNSNPSVQKYYMSDKYLPWAINIPVKFDYPVEKQDITKAFLMFNSWANSRGYNYMDWYINKNGYRDASKLYLK